MQNSWKTTAVHNFVNIFFLISGIILVVFFILIDFEFRLLLIKTAVIIQNLLLFSVLIYI